jgi:hypothetical protein
MNKPRERNNTEITASWFSRKSFGLWSLGAYFKFLQISNWRNWINFYVTTAVNSVFLYVTPCSFVDKCPSFRRTCCLHNQDNVGSLVRLINHVALHHRRRQSNCSHRIRGYVTCAVDITWLNTWQFIYKVSYVWSSISAANSGGKTQTVNAPR